MRETFKGLPPYLMAYLFGKNRKILIHKLFLTNFIKYFNMKHKTTCYPLGNADSTLIELSNGKKILFDYADMKSKDDANDKRIDLPAELNKLVKNDFDVVAFSHADEDHVKGFSEYFYLEHDKKYQSTDRKKINDLWVSAAVLLQKDSEISHEDGRIMKKEARYRLKNKARIKVFSKPEKLQDWLKTEGIAYDDVKHLLVNAGTLVPGWDLKNDGVEFFVHSPFSENIDDKNIDRNEACIILHATFNNEKNSKIIFGADADSSLFNDIVDITKYYKREERLEWDIFHISHHCSYKALNEADRGKSKTAPTAQVKWLFEEKGKEGGILISPSWEIPEKNEEVQPPHKEAAMYYKDVEALKKGEFRVTMEFPTKENPEPIIIEIGEDGVKIQKKVISAGFASSKTPPRAG
jgi:beta-lactamase superfamily II metal-dependent hydrolase